jgi:hypothetical protein
MLPRALIPDTDPVEVSRPRRQLDQTDPARPAEWEQRQSDFQIENVRFKHDPHWNQRIGSIQARRDGKTWFWRTIDIIWSTIDIIVTGCTTWI